jgi:hypothetical protein
MIATKKDPTDDIMIRPITRARAKLLEQQVDLFLILRSKRISCERPRGRRGRQATNHEEGRRTIKLASYLRLNPLCVSLYLIV